jgi:hypothetical protein
MRTATGPKTPDGIPVACRRQEDAYVISWRELLQAQGKDAAHDEVERSRIHADVVMSVLLDQFKACVAAGGTKSGNSAFPDKCRSLHGKLFEMGQSQRDAVKRCMQTALGERAADGFPVACKELEDRYLGNTVAIERAAGNEGEPDLDAISQELHVEALASTRPGESPATPSSRFSKAEYEQGFKECKERGLDQHGLLPHECDDIKLKELTETSEEYAASRSNELPPCTAETTSIELEKASPNWARFGVITGVAVAGAIVGAATETPNVGGVIGSVIGFLWTDNRQFDKVKEYVDKVTKGMVEQSRRDRLKKDFEHELDGLKSVADDYQQEPDWGLKGPKLSALIVAIKLSEPTFFDQDNPPEIVLPYLVALGTLKLAALREQYLFAKEYYGADSNRADHLRELKDTVNTYTSTAVDLKKRVYSWRIAKLECPVSKIMARAVRSPDDIDYISENCLVDHLCEKKIQSRICTDGMTAEEKQKYGWNRGAEYRAQCWNDMMRLAAGFNAALDAILQPVRTWKDYAAETDPATP